MLKEFKKQYQVWTYGDSSYSPSEFDSVKECVDYALSISSWSFYITKKCDVVITDKDLL